MSTKSSAINFDICILDFDNCMYPGISKVHVYLDIFLRILTKPYDNEDRLYLPILLFSSIQLLALRLTQKTLGAVTDGVLVNSYQKKLTYIPHCYIADSSAKIAQRIYPGTIETLDFLSKKSKVGIISLALMDVLESVNTILGESYHSSLSFIHGTYIPAQKNFRPILTSKDKLHYMKLELDRFNCSKPLVIGNDYEDLGMVMFAKELGGTSIGINPRAEIKTYFDFILKPKNWFDVLYFLTRNM